MVRWQPDARDRLEHAAMELFARQGFAETSVPQIAERAGLTTRTFFRHFSDKREVLFADEVDLPQLVETMLAAAPAEQTPMEIVEAGLDNIATTVFAGRRESLRARQSIIGSDASLRERELHKMWALSEALRSGFRGRGASGLDAALAAELTTTIVGISLARWLPESTERPLVDYMRETLAALRNVVAA